MPRNLREDFRMYYAGTFVVREEAGVRQVMYVSEVSYQHQGYNPSDILLSGSVGYMDRERRAVTFVADGNHQQWPADTLLPYHPESGYYQIGSTSTPSYVEFNTANRTNRKGFESQRAVVEGQGRGLNHNQVIRLMADLDFPGRIFSDCIIRQSRVLWRGMDVGTFHDGELALNESHAFLQDFISKYVGRITNPQEVANART